MNISERIQLLQVLYDGAYKQSKHEHNSLSARYFTIDNQNRVGEWSLATNTVFDNNTLTVCCIRSSYWSYGDKHNYNTFAIINKDGDIIDKITIGNWTINKLDFLPGWIGSELIPKISFSLINNPSETITLEFSSARSFQNIWDFFLGLSNECNTIPEAKLYHKYFENKIGRALQNQTINEYKQELETKNNIISQYEDLLKRIDKVVPK